MNTVKRSSSYLDLNWNFPLDHWPILHPAIPKSTQLQFWGTDSKELFEKNIASTPSNWMYRNTDVVYNFNSHGLRQKKELAEISQNNYIYSTGGCISLGVGVKEEDRYADIVTNSLGMDLINWGSPLGSIKYQTINFMNFLNTISTLPKIVIANHSPYATTTFYSNNEFLLYTEDILAADPIKFPHHLEAYKSLLKTDHSIYESYIWRHIMKTTCDKLNIKFIDVSFFSDDPFTMSSGLITSDIRKNLTDINYTWARDYRADAVDGTPYASHPGVGMHRSIANLILSHL
jgi:hypothetical protein